MAIDYSKFIFHTNKLPYQQLEKITSSITITGTILPLSTATFSGTTVNTGLLGVEARGAYQIPTGWTFTDAPAGSWINNGYCIKTYGSQVGLGQPGGLWLTMSVEVSGTNFTPKITVHNNTGSSITPTVETINMIVWSYIYPSTI
jgi:hypothetical protein